jgi:putative ABC transport system substrate-binding protein
MVARAQQGERVRLIGVLRAGDENEFGWGNSAFTQALADLGWIDGRNVQMDLRWGRDDNNRMRALAKELVGLQPDVILTNGLAATAAAQRETRTIPIVFAFVVDPVASGIVAQLDRPRGNTTGFTVRVAMLFNPANDNDFNLREMQEAARVIGLQIQVLNATTIGEIDAAFATFEHERPDALFVTPDVFFTSRRVQIATLAARGRIPAAFSVREHVVVGGLMSYGTDTPDRLRQIGVYTGKILNGTKPADLPVVQSTKFELVINLKTAKTLGLTIPETLLATADEVIQ